mmetsp:Transcript_6733/g.7320  ORF Transcript_6733/g.7320 Transcript_6733/m.7320 type:complete len:201 (-) Transcript_6733:38-640(-)
MPQGLSEGPTDTLNLEDIYNDSLVKHLSQWKDRKFQREATKRERTKQKVDDLTQTLQQGLTIQPEDLLRDLMTPENVEAVVHHPKRYAPNILYKYVKDQIKSRNPAGIGAALMNDKLTNITTCSDITASFYCTFSHRLFGVECLGWGGETCLELNATCADVKDGDLCFAAKSAYGLDCAGWGGSTCMVRSPKCSEITGSL